MGIRVTELKTAEIDQCIREYQEKNKKKSINRWDYSNNSKQIQGLCSDQEPHNNLRSLPTSPHQQVQVFIKPNVSEISVLLFIYFYTLKHTKRVTSIFTNLPLVLYPNWPSHQTKLYFWHLFYKNNINITLDFNCV